MRKVVIVDGVRTAFGRQAGTLKDFYPADLLGIAIKGLLEKTQIIEKGAKIDSVIAGSALQDAHTINFARYACLKAGLPYETSATFVEMQCGSAIASINSAAREIAIGDKDIIIAGGAESHSQKYVKFGTSNQPYKGVAPAAIPQMLAPIPEDSIPMIKISDKMAEKWGISREQCDEFALRSQMKAYKAQSAGYFDEEIIPVIIPQKKGDPIVFDKDEHLRPQTNMEGLSKLTPVLPGGVTTAGNASGMNDGASCVLMMDEETALRLGYKPIAIWVDGTDVGVDPKYMGIGPAFSNTKILQRNNLKLSDISVWECNEAFAAQNLSVIKEMESIMDEKIDMSTWNPNGGAISFGHPNGASGGRVCIFAMKELQRRGGKYACFSSCCGGGLGVSALIESYK